MELPEIILPQWLGKLVGKLPAKPPRFILVTALNTMLAKELLPADMSLFAGRKFEIDVLDAGVKIRFGANEEKFIANAFEGAPDLRLAANGVDFMRMIMREEDPDTLFFKRKLQIEGDTELGLITKNLLDSVDWPLSHWFLNRDMPQ
ncbi:Sterol-binding domain protein [Neisseria sp. N95_16]|uniref:Ubiquinone biosynthesis accessory factor UbiT n=1 Tax=Neisseria brasiliensis TaxID=2666100 RepID=A0A5Q3S0L2_9NEIS|nr:MULTISPECIES: SCP2 sterol-binding domain-containing protein [Neisseria]MRN38497.1 Sterol-binding domain protein [Neisseria brasiliensis]PJO09483.1 Sterol-binding domain protein [Neisseria sp. N95_16]PJO77790.1 Sterol-binding domain protein [Neisseria sp. N177_16]QGL25475.1 Sterol-binding domain protein [Neisseria brasiliensis]